MTKNTTLVVAVLLVVLIAGAVIIKKSHRFSSTMPSTESTQVASSAPEQMSATPSAAMKETLINISSTGFSPAQVTIKAGDSVTWMNSDSAPHQVNSNPHPTHTDYPPLNTIGLLQPGEKKSLAFPTPGVYKFHDHLHPSFQGSVTVE